MSDEQGKSPETPAEEPGKDSVTVTLQLQINRPAAETGAVSFGLGEDLQTLRDRITQSLQQLSDQVGQALNRTAQDVSQLKVSTWVAEDSALTPELLASQDPFKTARLVAQTSIGLDGDTRVLLSPDADREPALLQVHDEMVGRAQANRSEVIKMAVSAIAGLVDVLGNK